MHICRLRDNKEWKFVFAVLDVDKLLFYPDDKTVCACILKVANVGSLNYLFYMLLNSFSLPSSLVADQYMVASTCYKLIYAVWWTQKRRRLKTLFRYEFYNIIFLATYKLILLTFFSHSLQ